LSLYGRGSPDVETALANWHELATSQGSDPEAVRQAREHLDSSERQALSDAQAALHWRAEHLASLWD
jgi:hypothetical protein